MSFEMIVKYHKYFVSPFQQSQFDNNVCSAMQKPKTTMSEYETRLWQKWYSIQGDHSPDNVKFPDGSWHCSAALGMLSVIHIIPVLVW